MIGRGSRVPPAAPKITSVRSLTEADLVHLRERAGVPAKHISRLHDSHHTIARFLAAGLKIHEVAEATGSSISRIGRLKIDPSVKELIAHYQSLLTEDWREQQDHLARLATSNMLKAERMLADKLDAADEADEFLPTRELVSITSDRMDRFGYGKKTANLNINVDFAAKLEEAIARSGKAKFKELEE